MKNNQKSQAVSIRSLDQDLIDNLYKELSKQLSDLIKELNNSSQIGAFGAMVMLSSKISEVASDLKKLQHLPTMLTNPYMKEDPRDLLNELNKKYGKKKKK